MRRNFKIKSDKLCLWLSDDFCQHPKGIKQFELKSLISIFFNCIIFWIRYTNCTFYSTSHSKIRSETDSSHWQKAKYVQRKKCPSTGLHATKEMMWMKKQIISLIFWLKPFNRKQPLLLKAEENIKTKISVSSVVHLSVTDSEPSITTLVPKPFLLVPSNVSWLSAKKYGLLHRNRDPFWRNGLRKSDIQGRSDLKSLPPKERELEGTGRN